MAIHSRLSKTTFPKNNTVSFRCEGTIQNLFYHDCDFKPKSTWFPPSRCQRCGR